MGSSGRLGYMGSLGSSSVENAQRAVGSILIFAEDLTHHIPVPVHERLSVPRRFF